MTTVVRSLWFTPTMQFTKVMRDVIRSPRVAGQQVYAYGDTASAFLTWCRISHTVLPDRLPDEYPRHAKQWWRKLIAVRHAIRQHGPVIHLDWDTLVKGGRSDVESGPAIQGRLFAYKRSQNGSRHPYHRYVYHGGCFYVRDYDAIDRVIAIHAARHPCHTDEVALTEAVDEMCGDSSPETQRENGYDNPRLYGTSRNVVASDALPAFREGRVIRPQRFVKYLAGAIAAAEPRKRLRRFARGADRSPAALQRAMRPTVRE